MSRALLTALLIGVAVPALADEKASIVIRDDGFAPAEVQVPAGTKIELSIKNEQKSASNRFAARTPHRVFKKLYLPKKVTLAYP